LSYLGLFWTCFLSATIIPIPSEAAVIGFLSSDYNVWLVVLVASIGNTLGGCTNYLIGRGASSSVLLDKFNINTQKVERWQQKTNRWGAFLGLLAWVPFIGDPMVIVLGFLKVPFWKLSFWILVGKTLRYAFIAYLFL